MREPNHWPFHLGSETGFLIEPEVHQFSYSACFSSYSKPQAAMGLQSSASTLIFMLAAAWTLTAELPLQSLFVSFSMWQTGQQDTTSTVI